MRYQKQYVYDDFVSHVKNRCADEYAALMSSDQWPLQHKTITQGLRSSKRVPMLRVGTPHHRNGVQIMYAFATGLTVEYYCGYEAQEYVWPLSKLAGNRVYFGEPLIFVSGQQDTQNMTKSRRNGRALAELIISVIFLQYNELGYIDNCQDRDLVQDFEYACVNFETNREIANDKKRAKEVEYWANEEAQESAKVYRKHASQHQGMYGGVKVEPESDDDSWSTFPSSANRTPSPAVSYAAASRMRTEPSHYNATSSRGHKIPTRAVLPVKSTARRNEASSAATSSRRFSSSSPPPRTDRLY
jgi:hypothetical protein